MRLRFLYMSLFSFFLVGMFFSGHSQAIGVDFTKISALIIPDERDRTINGIVGLAFVVHHEVDSVFIDAKAMRFFSVHLEGKNIDYSYDNKRLGFKPPQQKGNYQLELRYEAKPKQTLYWIGYDDSIKGNEQIWTQGQGKYTSYWLPSFDDMTEKVEFDLTFETDLKQIVISNGRLLHKKKIPQTAKQQWHFDMKKPMSSYLVAFAMGELQQQTIQSKTDIPISLFYSDADSLRVEPTYRYSQEIFDFLEEEIGVSYPWQNYKQVPVHDFLYAGMENTSCTFFSNQYMVDSIGFMDKNYVNVNAHELAHQWFGNLVTETDAAQHWLHEGFATFYAYKAEKEVFGDDYFYWKWYETANILEQSEASGLQESLVNPKSSSLTFYEKGAWACLMLENLMGETDFKLGIKEFLTLYAFDNTTVAHFFEVMQRHTTHELKTFIEKWIYADDFPHDEAMAYLTQKYNPIASFLKLKSSLNNYENRIDPICQLWQNIDSDGLKKELIKAFHQSMVDPKFLELLTKESLPVRQQWVLSVPDFNPNFKDFWEGFLEDSSYLTKEVTLFKLWQAFPNERIGYLNQTQGIVGLPNKNLRLVWLTLALITPEFNPNHKTEYYEQLNHLTDSHEHWEVRMTAFEYLNQIGAMSKSSLANLATACEHPVWQFNKSCRNLVREIYSTPNGKIQLEECIKTNPTVANIIRNLISS